MPAFSSLTIPITCWLLLVDIDYNSIVIVDVHGMGCLSLSFVTNSFFVEPKISDLLISPLLTCQNHHLQNQKYPPATTRNDEAGIWLTVIW